MAETTGISWCDATFNPWWGCERVSPGCAHCYAADLAKRYGHAGTWGEKGEPHGFRFFGDAHWRDPLRWARTLPAKLGRRPRVFCASMADVFEPRDELEEHRLRLLDLIAETPALDWLLLTKRPELAAEWLDWRYDVLDLDGPLPNVWLGTSVENQRFTWRADALREAPAAVRFISAEPLLGSLIAAPDSGLGERPARPSHAALEGQPGGAARGPLDLDEIDWLIVGGESGPKARPVDPQWVRELRDEAVERGIAFHFKQWGGRTSKAGGKVLDGREWCDFPDRERSLVPA